MRGYYYDQTGEAPRSTPAPISAGRRRRWSGAAAVLLFLLTMALLGGLTAAAGLWSHSRLEELPALADSTWQPLPVREEQPEETTVERAPTGDGNVGPAAVVVGAQRILHVEGGHLRRHVVVLAAPIGADQETKVRQRSRVTHRLQA